MRGLIVSTLALVLVACGTTSGEDSTTTVPSTTTTAVTPPATTPVTSPPETTTPAPTTVPAVTPPSGVFVISIDGTSIVGGGRLEVALGDRVTIRVESDTTDEAHLHGYDLHADVGPGESGEISFEATIPGIFELELEDSRILLGELVVS